MTSGNRESVHAPAEWSHGLLTLGGAMWPGQTPREVQATSWGRRPQARACYQRMLGWRPKRVLFAHGRCYLDDAAAQLERAFAWLR